MRTLVILLLLACGGAALANDEHDARRQRIDYAMGEDRIVTGGRALSSGAVSGDLILAGGEVAVVAPVGGDLVALGGNVRIDAETGQNLYAGGGNVALNAGVRRNVRLAGGRVEIGSRAKIGGNATLAGGNVLVLGDIDGHLAVAGGRVFLNGRVNGNVTASGAAIELGANARIGGELRYRSPAAVERAAGSEVHGGVLRAPQVESVGEAARVGAAIVGGFMLIWTLGLMLAAAVYVALLPRFTAQLAGTARARPGLSLLIGFAALFATPPIAALLLATGIGLPLGLLLLLAYWATLLLGLLSIGVAVGQWGLQRLQPARAERTGWRAAAAATAFLLLALLGAIPLLGWLAGFLLWMIGIGALLQQLRATTQAPAA